MDEHGVRFYNAPSVMIVTKKNRNKNSMVTILIEVFFFFSKPQDDIEANATQPTIKLALFMIFFFFFFGEIVHEILDVKNMTHIYFGWDHNQDVTILAFLKYCNHVFIL